MTNETELRDRIAEVISKATTAWIKDEYVTDLSEGDYIAQAIIDEFGLTVETALVTRAQCGLPDFIGSRVVGKWEKQ